MTNIPLSRSYPQRDIEDFDIRNEHGPFGGLTPLRRAEVRDLIAEVRAQREITEALLEYVENEDPEGLRGEEARLFNKLGAVLLKHGVWQDETAHKGKRAP